MSTWLSVLVILVGVYSLVGGLLDWEWFMTTGRQARFVARIGRKRARIVYIALGLLLSGLGFASAFGLVR